jgi:hypothetical protein
MPLSRIFSTMQMMFVSWVPEELEATSQQPSHCHRVRGAASEPQCIEPRPELSWSLVLNARQRGEPN